MKNLYKYLKEELATPLNTVGMGNIENEPLVNNKNCKKKKNCIDKKKTS